MSKRLIGLVLVASVVCFFSAAYAEVQNVKVGGDITVVGVSRDNVNQGSHSSHAALIGGIGATGMASIARIKVEANLTDNVDVTFRLLNERAWGTLDGVAAPYSPAVDVDQAYVTLKDFLKDQIGVPLTLKLGRQDIKLGSGLLVADPNTNQVAMPGSNFVGTALGDLDANKAFDAAVAIADFTPFTLIGGVVKGLEGGITNNKDDLNVWLVQGAYKLDAMKTNLELTVMDEPRNKIVYTTTPGDIRVIDGRITTTPVENLNLEAEYAYQTYKSTAIRADRRTVSDNAFRLAATFGLPSVAMSPSIGMDYTRLSKNWQPMFEDLTPADIMNLLFANTNAQVIGATVSAKATQDVALKLRYATARAFADLDKGTGGSDTYTSAGTGCVYNVTHNKAMGQEVDFGVAYDYTDDVQFGLNLGYFIPGKAFLRDSRASQSQVIGSMKVSF